MDDAGAKWCGALNWFAIEFGDWIPGKTTDKNQNKKTTYTDFFTEP